MNKDRIMVLCDHCIAAIQSRGERLFVSNECESYETDEEKCCEWCEEPSDVLYDVIIG